MTEQTKPLAKRTVETCAPFTRRYKTPLGELGQSDAIFVTELVKNGAIEVKLSSIDGIKAVNNGPLFVMINMENMRYAKTISRTYFIIKDGVVYSYEEFCSNPLGKVIVLSISICVNKIRIIRVDKQFVEFEIREDGWPLICHLVDGAESYQILSE
jgi:hypothetical protein